MPLSPGIVSEQLDGGHCVCGVVGGGGDQYVNYNDVSIVSTYTDHTSHTHIDTAPNMGKKTCDYLEGVNNK